MRVKNESSDPANKFHEQLLPIFIKSEDNLKVLGELDFYIKTELNLSRLQILSSANLECNQRP